MICRAVNDANCTASVVSGTTVELGNDMFVSTDFTVICVKFYSSLRIIGTYSEYDDSHGDSVRSSWNGAHNNCCLKMIDYTSFVRGSEIQWS